MTSTQHSRPCSGRNILWLSVSAVLCGPVFAWAQAATGDTDATAEQSDSSRIEQVIVYGEKLQRSYLDTYSSVGIVTAEELDNYDIADTSDAFKRLANVRAFSQGAGSKSISIRGLEADGVTQPSNAAALISVIVDGVTQSSEGLKRGSRGLWDVAQLEVHRGPQGTIQGRNALAGTVVIKSKDPTFDPEYKVRALYGELDRRELAGVASGPIIKDTLAYRISGEYAEKTSDINFTDPAREPFAEDKYHNIRGKLLFRPQGLESLEVLLTVNDVFDSPSSSPVDGPNFYDRNFAAGSVYAELREMDLQNYAVDVAWALRDGVTLRSITSYNDTDLEISSVPSSEVYFREDHREDGDFQQEFRVEINQAIAGITGVAGVFYGSFEQDSVSDIVYYFAGNPFFTQIGAFANETETWAAYADLRYGLTDALSLIVGGRYQDDSVRNAANVETLSGNNVYDLDSGFDVFLPKLGLSLDVTDSQSIGLTASRGYRQGFVENQSATASLNKVDPEFVWSYEIAYRISALNDRLLLGANLFYNDYSDQQIAVTDPDLAPLVRTLNVGESSSWGAELQTQYFFGNGLNIYASLGLLETELGDFPAEGCLGGSCEGNQYAEAPQVTASLGGDYTHSSGFFASVASSYTDEFFTSTLDNSVNLEVDSSFVVDARVGYKFTHFTLAAYANNLFDEDYMTGRNTETQAFVGDGRAMGLEVTAAF